MDDSINPAIPDLLARIVEAIENGGRLTAAILDYIDAALFPPEPDGLRAFLNDDGDGQRDSLLDLIFSPDEAVQIDMEPLLEAARCSRDDEAVLHAHLKARAVDARILLPDGGFLVKIPVPDAIKSQYLARLAIARRLDPEVAAAVEKHVSPSRQPFVKVRLRNAGIRLAPGQRLFLCRFFEYMADTEPDFAECLDLVLSLLETAGTDVNGYDLLAAHKRFLFRSLQQIRRFEIQLRQSNMETLMLQGVRAPHASSDELARHMHLIDRIAVGIFGTTEIIAPLIDAPVREVTELDHPAPAVRSLLG
jgi:hypothetical protein